MCLSSQTNAHIRRVGGMSSVFFVLLPTQHDACCISWDHQDFNDLNYISLSFSSLCTVYIFVLWPFSFLILFFGHYSYIPLFLAIINLNTNGLSEKNNYHLVGQVLFFFQCHLARLTYKKETSQTEEKKTCILDVQSSATFNISQAADPEEKMFGLVGLVQTAASALFL